MVFRKVEKLEVRAVGGRGNWDKEKLANDLKALEPGYYEVGIEEFLNEYYTGNGLENPVVRAKTVLRAVIEENGLDIEVYGSPKNGKLGLKVGKPKK